MRTLNTSSCTSPAHTQININCLESHSRPRHLAMFTSLPKGKQYPPSPSGPTQHAALPLLSKIAAPHGCHSVHGPLTTKAWPCGGDLPDTAVARCRLWCVGASAFAQESPELAPHAAHSASLPGVPQRWLSHNGGGRHGLNGTNPTAQRTVQLQQRRGTPTT